MKPKKNGGWLEISTTFDESTKIKFGEISFNPFHSFYLCESGVLGNWGPFSWRHENCVSLVKSADSKGERGLVILFSHPLRSVELILEVIPLPSIIFLLLGECAREADKINPWTTKTVNR